MKTIIRRILGRIDAYEYISLQGEGKLTKFMLASGAMYKVK